MSIKEAKDQLSKGVMLAAATLLFGGGAIGGTWVYDKLSAVEQHEVRITVVENAMTDVDSLAESVDRLNTAINVQNALLGRIDERLKAQERTSK
ncbi:MAG: hypothetical protein Q7Q73_06425 [Verrucomicrobiota bacterium JB024]|nr:hypothetical protein [Verrucomicrobiota bacterium JB024]